MGRASPQFPLTLSLLYPTTLQVKDHDLVGKHDDLGDYSLRIDDLPPLKPVDLELALCHTTQVNVML